MATAAQRTVDGQVVRRDLAHWQRRTRREPDGLLDGRYELVRRLAGGGMGEAWLARQRGLDRCVVVKFLRPAPDQRSATLRAARFRRELRALGRLDHPQLVRAYDVVETEAAFALVLEYIDGQTLADWVAECGPLPIAVACEIARQAAEGLAGAHAAGVISRDVKPANIMVARSATNPRQLQVKLIDLGLARLDDDCEQITQDGSILGTLPFMAPEQADRPHDADHRADLYGLGAALYFSLTGHAPLGDKGSLAEWLRRLLAQEPRPVRELRPDCPAALEQLVTELLAKDPAQRPASAAVVAARLAECLADIEWPADFSLPAPADPVAQCPSTVHPTGAHAPTISLRA